MLRIVVGKNEPTGMLAAHGMDTKGPTDKWIAKRLVKDIEQLERGDIGFEDRRQAGYVGAAEGHGRAADRAHHEA